MTSSLVGSEMCIRDSDWTVLEKDGQKYPNDKNPVTVWYDYMKEKYTPNAVSYTHLTLPTICSV
eukprot:11825270-Prorocentrum_lima.AAC.1